MADHSSSDESVNQPTTTTTPSRPAVEFDDPDTHPGISLLDGFRIIFGLALLSGLLSYFITGDSVLWGYKPWWTQPQAVIASLRGPVRLTDAQLLRYNGEDETLPIYLALNGTIYDVTSNPRIYGPGGMYSVFSGRDASRGFVTGCFAVDNVPDLRGVEWVHIPKDVPTFEEKKDEELTEQMREYRNDWLRDAQQEVRNAVEHWQKVFRGETGKNYFEVGYIVGRKEEMGPVRELCKQRPKEGFEKWMQKRRSEKAKAAKEQGSVKAQKKDEL